MAEKTFYPNACYVCNKYGEGIHMNRCADCRMISYCNMQHRKEHWPQHQVICQAIQKVLNGKPYMNTDKISVKKWTHIRAEYLQAVSTKLLPRKLSLSEQAMFWFSRACVVCHRQDELINCNNCPSASFCNKHKTDPEHTNHCRTLKLCFEIDTKTEVGQMNFSHYKVFEKYYSDMTILLDNYALFSEGSALPSQFLKTFYSEYVSKPLTVLFAIKQLNLRLDSSKFVVHVVASYISDTIRVNQWEFLLHEMPHLKTLTIIYIGSDVKMTDPEISNLCDICTKKKRKIVYKLHPMRYWLYMRTEKFKKPNIIVEFDVFLYKFYDKDNPTAELSMELMASAQALMEQNCPYILTFWKLPNIKDELADTNSRFWGKNPFMSLRPYRDTASQIPYYNNQYLIIYENIKDCPIVVQDSFDN